LNTIYIFTPLLSKWLIILNLTGIKSSLPLSNNANDRKIVKEVYRKDFELVKKVLQGDQFAFGVLVRQYQMQIAKTVIGMLGKTQEAEDVGQEVFIRFYRSMEQYKGDSALGTYLTRIAINLSLNALKKQNNKRTNDLSRAEYHLSSEDIAAKRDTKEVVQEALQKLDPDFRSVVVLRMIEGYSTKETAELLKLPLGTVLSRLSRAQTKLKGLLKKEIIH
jgi:RNA polymerase sigma-70 factor (ECF subfamily)